MDLKLPGFLRRARIESKKTKNIRIKMGAVISKNGSVISVGYNQRKTHPLTNTFTLHAEAAAIIARRYEKSLDGCTIWVYRQKKNGIPALAKPCKDCMRLIVASGINRIFYTTDEKPYWKCLNI